MGNSDVLSRLLGNLASVTGAVNGRNIASFLEGFQNLVKAGTSGAAQNVPNTNPIGSEVPRPSDSSLKTSNNIVHQDPPESRLQCATVPSNHTAPKCIPSSSVGLPPRPVAVETTAGRNGLINIDLNNVYDDAQDVENPESSRPYVASGVGSHDHPSFVQYESLKSSPPQTSRNSDSTSTQSPSSSSGEGQVIHGSNSECNSFYDFYQKISSFDILFIYCFYVFRVEQTELFSNSLARILMISLLFFDHRYSYPSFYSV